MHILIIYSCALIIYIKWIYKIIFINFIYTIIFSCNNNNNNYYYYYYLEYDIIPHV